MAFKERLKNNPYISNWRYPVTYFIAGSAILVLIFLITKDGPIPLSAYLCIPFTAIFYIIYAAGKMLSTNFIIKNHRSTPFLLSIIIGVFTIIFSAVRAFAWDMMVASTIYFSAGLVIIGAVYLFFNARNKSASLLYLALFTLTFAVHQYLTVSFVILDYGGASLFVLAGGGFFSVIIFTLYYLRQKKLSFPPASLEALKLRFENYINRVFTGLPATDEIFTIKEQLFASLVVYAKQNLQLGVSEDMLFAGALDSLGDYSGLLAPYKKNIFARLTGLTNKTVNLVLSIIVQGGLAIFYILSLQSSDWAIGGNMFDETYPIIIFVALFILMALFLMRVVFNFRTGHHSLTAVLLGAALLMPLIVAAILFSLDTQSSFRITPLFGYLIGATAFSAVVGQITINIFLERKKRLAGGSQSDNYNGE